ncbi:MAG: glycosyltransferase [Nitrososphaerota archaeon]|nr:glycosyltransferase [Candidatus Aenigmarchaeota archaeon]MDW8034701.1 glycosyltransferase [Nitrososphaerota archaeon]
MHCLVIAVPYFPHGGAGKRAFEVLKYFTEINFIPILYIPYSDLLFLMVLEELYKLERVDKILKELEHFNVIIPNEIYECIDDIRPNIQHHLDLIRSKHVYGLFLNFKKPIQESKYNIIYAKKFLAEYIKSKDIPLDKLEFIYSMHEIPSSVITGAFLAKSLKRRLYILLQLEPFKPLKDLVIDDWRFRVMLGRRHISREIVRLLFLILKSVLISSRYSYSYAFYNKVLSGLLAVSEAPLIISGLDSWASERNINVKIVRPGNAVEESFSVYADEKERCQLFHKKEDVAIYYARLHSSKGLFDIPPIAKKLASEGYRLVIVGDFVNAVEKNIFFRLCKEQGIKNIEYLNWLPREDLLDIVSRSKVLIYPSHLDSFSLVVLEALFLGCSVVAYDIPAIRSIYKDLKPVRIVREYDYRKMAGEAIKILKRDIDEHEEEHLDKDFMNFLKIHSSWRNVAKADIEAIEGMIHRS